METKRVILFALAFVVLFNIFLHPLMFGLSFGFLFLALNIYLLSLVEKKASLWSLICSALSVTFAFLIAWRANGMIQTIDFLLASFFLCAAIYFYHNAKSPNLLIPSFLMIPWVFSINALQSLWNYFQRPDLTAKNDESASLVRGILIASPVVIVLFFLLTNADPIFAKLSQNFVGNIGERSVVSLMLFLGLFVAGITRFKAAQEQNDILKVSNAKTQELMAITISVVLLFAVFIVIQFQYLFSGVGERELYQLGINSSTYSEYVRKGFFELLVAAAIAGLVVIYVLRYLHSLGGNGRVWLQIFGVLLTTETGLLLLSAVKRLSLYTDAHGLTRARIFGFIFLIWLTAILVLLLVRSLKELRREWIFNTTLGITVAVFFAVNLFNIDGLIATKYRPTVNDEIDYYYLTGLSTDGAASWKDAVEDAQKTITRIEGVKEITPEDNRQLYWARLTLEQLNGSLSRLNEQYGSEKEVVSVTKEAVQRLSRLRSWQALNFADLQAYGMAAQAKLSVGEIIALQNRLNTLEAKVTDDVRARTQYDRSEEAPLTR